MDAPHGFPSTQPCRVNPAIPHSYAPLEVPTSATWDPARQMDSEGDLEVKWFYITDMHRLTAPQGEGHQGH